MAGNSRVQRAERLIETGAGSERAAEDVRVERDVAAAELAAATGPAADDRPRAARLRRRHHAAGAHGCDRALGPRCRGAGGRWRHSAARTRHHRPAWVRVPAGAAELGIVDETSAEVTPLAGRAAPVTATRVAGPAARRSARRYRRSLLRPLCRRRVPPRRARRRRPGDAASRTLVVPRSAIVHDLHGGAWVYVPLGEHRYDRRRVELSGVTGDLALCGPRARGWRRGRRRRRRRAVRQRVRRGSPRSPCTG